MSQDVYTTDEDWSTGPDNNSDNSVHTRPRLYPVRLRDMGSVYAQRLFDVEGKMLVDEDYNPISLHNPGIMEEFNNKKIRCIRHPDNDYRYFITSERQKQRFIKEREEGSETRLTVFYIYRDNDTDEQITRLRQKVRHYRMYRSRYHTR